MSLSDRIAAILAMDERRTSKGLWAVDDDTYVYALEQGPDDGCVLAPTDGDAARGETYTPEDAAFIAAAPEMVAIIRELQAQLAAITAHEQAIWEQAREQAAKMAEQMVLASYRNSIGNKIPPQDLARGCAAAIRAMRRE